MRRLAMGSGAGGLVVLLLALGGCGPERGSESPPAGAASDAVTLPPPYEAAEPPEPEPFDVSRLADFRDPSVGTATSDFAHEPHRQIDCRTCHESPAGHASHGAVECRECHDAPATGTTRTGPAECMACHHAPARRDECTTCHDGFDALPGARVNQIVEVAGTGADRTRELDFRHDLHPEVSCTACHQTPGRFDVEGGCASCHESHHRPDADCLACHAPLPLAAHDADVHEGCNGSECHTDPTVVSLPWTRSVCLACHQEQVDHEPGRDCALCHQTAAPTDGKGTRRGVRAPGSLPRSLPEASPPPAGRRWP